MGAARKLAASKGFHRAALTLLALHETVKAGFGKTESQTCSCWKLR
ncbi:hypothetical protein [Polaromonas sp. CG9_12]|nr:hypothetical protein [Polaromonas sp. CG9_12]